MSSTFFPAAGSSLPKVEELFQSREIASTTSNSHPLTDVKQQFDY